MALTFDVTLQSVSTVRAKMWNINLNLSMLEAAVEVRSRDFTIVFKTGDDVQAKVVDILADMQKAVDAYTAEQGIEGAAQLATAITYLENNLTE